MIYFIFKKASKPLANKQQWINYGLRPVIFASLVFTLVFVGYYEINLFKSININISYNDKTEAA